MWTDKMKDLEAVVTKNNATWLLLVDIWIKEESQDENPVSMQTTLQVICLHCREIAELLYSLALAPSKFIIFGDFN